MDGLLGVLLGMIFFLGMTGIIPENGTLRKTHQ
jgi:hypothetical protein